MIIYVLVNATMLFVVTRMEILSTVLYCRLPLLNSSKIVAVCRLGNEGGQTELVN